jgi:hypothetical protein
MIEIHNKNGEYYFNDQPISVDVILKYPHTIENNLVTIDVPFDVNSIVMVFPSIETKKNWEIGDSVKVECIRSFILHNDSICAVMRRGGIYDINLINNNQLKLF